MRVKEPLRFPVRVEMHLPGGFTQVRVLSAAHLGLLREIPTARVPPGLRPLGSSFMLTEPVFRFEDADIPEDVRACVYLVDVDPLDSAGA